MVYTLDGEFIQSLNHDYTIVYQRMVGQDRFASVAFPYVPFESGSYGLGVFSDKADTIAMKNDFSSPLVSHEKPGLLLRWQQLIPIWKNPFCLRQAAMIPSLE